MEETRELPLTEKEESSLMEEVLSAPLSKEVDIKKNQWNKCKDGLKTYRTKYKEIQAQMKEEEKRAKAQIRLEYNRKIKQEMKGKKDPVEISPPLLLQETSLPPSEENTSLTEQPPPPLVVETIVPPVEKSIEKEIPLAPLEKKRPNEELFEMMEMYEEYKAKKNKKVPDPPVEALTPSLPPTPPVHENIARLVAPKSKTDSRLHVPDDSTQKFFFLRR